VRGDLADADRLDIHDLAFGGGKFVIAGGFIEHRFADPGDFVAVIQRNVVGGAAAGDSGGDGAKRDSESETISDTHGIKKGMVRLAGLEPARVTPLPPQSSVSANSTISATASILNQ
jgi:hypothetical protein